LILVCGGFALAAFTGCSRPAASAPVGQPAPMATHAVQTPPADQAAPPARTATGTVAETMDAANYTYLRVKTTSGDVWAAASQFKVAVGDTVSFALEQPMENFHSKALGRDFPLIYFVTDISRNGASASAVAMTAAHAGAAAPQAVTTPIEPAKGGSTIENVWKNRQTLAGKTVTVRGKVMKFNGGILGVNWLHIQDGSGKADDGSNDLTVTSDEEARVGDIVTITGTVAVDKDLGSGYKYGVIVEGARLTK
jgi:ribosomal protein S17